MDIEGRGKSSSFEVGHAPASVSLRPQTPEEKAAAAARVADDLEHCAEFVRDDVGAVRIAVAAGDPADWADAAQDARNGLAHLRQLVDRAPAAMRDAYDAQVRTRLESAPQALTDAETLVAGVPAMPSPDAPIVRCADAVAAVLPPGRAPGWQEQRAFSDVVAAQATYSDLVALRSILEGKAQHPLTSRFQQFSPSTRKLLVRILCDRDLTERAGARQAVQRQARRAKARANNSTTAAPPDSMAPPPIGSTRDDVAAGDPSAGPVRGAMPDRKGEALPHRAEMEHAFGGSFSDVKAHKGMAAELEPMGARALTVGNEVLFADETPPPALVAHEATHLMQNKQAGTSVAMASGIVAPRDSAAEAEADAMAGLVAAHGPGVRLPAITAAPAAQVQLAPNETVPVLRLDKSKEARQLHAMIAMRQQPQIVELLEQNANPEHMYALHRAYGSTLVADVRGALTEAAYVARARVYLGEQMALDAKIETRGTGDLDAILGDLERLPDARALALFAGDAVPIAWTQPERGTWLPATTTLASVQQALHRRLNPDDYYRAMRVLLAKAERAIAVEVAQAPPGPSLEGFTVTLDDLAIDPSRTGSHPSPLALSPVSRARVDLAEARIREADASGNWIAEPMKGRAATLALTDLSRNEREALALRLHDRPLVNVIGGVSLGADALDRDDATVIQKAILNVQTLANLQARAARGVGLDVAMERAGELVRAARAKLEQLPPHAPEAERQRAQAEVQRLESMFFGDSSPVLAVLRMNAQRAGDSDGGVAAVGSQLRALGADSVTIAAEELRAVPAGDVTALISTLRKIAAGDRIVAMQRAGLLDALSSGSMRLAPDQREMVNALVWQGSQPFQIGPPGADAPKNTDATASADAPIIMPPMLAPPLLGPRPEVVIALHDILDAMDRRAVHEVLGRLARMPDADQRAIYADPRYRAKFNALPQGHPQSGAGHFKDSLRTAETSDARAALLGYPTTIESEHKVHLEAIGAQVDDAGPSVQADLRRAYVLVERLGGAQRIRTNPALLASLPPVDRAAVERLVGGTGSKSGGLLGKRDHLDRDDDQETANQLIFGQPQLGKGPGALDPASEAEFMYYRLREAAGIRDGVSIADWFNTAGPSADESVAEFMVLYQRVHGAGVSRGQLAQLADLYHRSLRRLDSYRKVADSLAGTAAQIVGATVATIVVTVASGGTLGPVAVAAMASVSAAAGSAAAGAALRVHNTMSSVLKDAGTGAVEGIATAAGASLAARMVRGAAMGLPAGRAAASVGARAVGQASHAGTEIAAAVIESALGGAAGELFQTATDEATWDHGVAEAFAAMLAAIARGAGSGAAIGGAVGGAVQVAGKLVRLIARVGRPAAQDFTRIAESAGVAAKTLEHLSERDQEQIARALDLARAGQIAEAERLLSSVDGLSGQERAIARKAASESSAAKQAAQDTGASPNRTTSADARAEGPISQPEAASLLLDEIERNAGGLRRPALETIDPAEMKRLQQEFADLGGDPEMLQFNQGRRTGFKDDTNTIQVRGDVNPVEDSLHPRSAMSSKAALGHELGHAAHRGTKLPIGAWNDEFRASYWAAKNLPNLTEIDRIHLILDAIERAKEAGVSIRPNALMRKILYGY